MNRFPALLSVIALIFAVLACSDGTVATPQAASPTSLAPVVEPTSQPENPEPAPAILETRRLTLEFPSKMRAGVEGDIIRLKLEVDDLGNITPTAQFEGNTVVGETIQIPDLYETHNVTAEANLDMAGMLIQPADAIYEPLKRGQSATFFWSIRPQEPGIYRGTVWLHLNFEEKSTGEQTRIAVSAQIVEVEAVDFFGLSVNLARTSGVIGAVVGGVIGFPFIEDIIKFLFKRRKTLIFFCKRPRQGNI
ncbi:MAG: hypothetical protein IPL71_09505 [Anaerolineales bacterium]|uniref:hypothetical protein n=1 Tax=Candidatus Villigracilis proximus TaxID=3140683 RepID=UPI0031367A78|nr:hypothetical protein [Anaerolineales bacterium]